MASPSSLSRIDPVMDALDRRAAPRLSTCDHRHPSQHDAVLLGTTSFYGDSVYDVAGNLLGEIAEIVLDLRSGRVAYALMAARSFPGIDRRLFAIPWSAVTIDRAYQRCVLNIDQQRLVSAPGIDGDLLPRMTDPRWASEVHAYFGCKPYWE